MFNRAEDIKKLRIKLNLTQEEFAKQLNISQQYLSYIEKGQKTLSAEKFNILKDIAKEAEEKLGDKTIEIDYYPDIFASCGDGTYILSDNRDVRRISAALLPHFSDTHKYSICTARGDSMQPTIQSGNTIVVQHYQNEQINDNGIYIFCYNDEIFVKRLSKNINQVIIKSDNPIYSPITLKDDEINQLTIIGKIVGVLYN